MIGQPFQVFVTPPRFPSCVREYGTVGPLDFVGDGSENKFPALFFATFRNLLILLAAERTPPIRIFHAHQGVSAAAVRSASGLICAGLETGHTQARRGGHPVLFLAKLQIGHCVVSLISPSRFLVHSRFRRQADYISPAPFRRQPPDLTPFHKPSPVFYLSSSLSRSFFGIVDRRPPKR